MSEYIFNKEQLEDIGFKDFPLGWYSDVLAVLEFSDFRELYTINEALVYIRISDLSISGSQRDLVLKSKSTLLSMLFILTYIYCT